MIGRLFNTVGPRQTGRYGMVVPTFVRQALAGEPITVHGDGQQRRCFCHVKDVVSAIADLMESDAAVGEVFNIGSTEEVTISELAERVRTACDSDSEIRFVPYEEAYEAGSRRAGAPGVRIRVRDSFDSLRRGIRDWFRGHATPYPGHQQDRRSARLARDAHAGRNTGGRDRVSEGAGGAHSERVIGPRSTGKSRTVVPRALGSGKGRRLSGARCAVHAATPASSTPPTPRSSGSIAATW